MRALRHMIFSNLSGDQQVTSRRSLLTSSLKLAGGGALALAFASSGVPLVPGLGTVYAQSPFASDVDVLNYALTLEHLEHAFYRDGIGLFDFGTDGFGQSINTNMEAIRDHEAGHVATLTEVVASLGGTPVAEQVYNFTDAYASIDGFLATAAALENTGVSAYDGAGQFLANPDLLTAAGSIVAVEARHASYLNLITNESPFPAAFETPLTMDEVLAIAGPFFA